MKMRTIILAAGQGGALDGVVKSLIKHPQSGLTVLDHQINAFKDCDITVVVGYKAIEIMQAYPKLNFLYNPDWAITNNAYSLGLALDERPSYVMSGDLFFSSSIRSVLDVADNTVLISHRENRCLTAINCITEGDRLRETYIGPLRSSTHGEAIGVFRISNTQLLKAWKNSCLLHSNLFVGQALPLDAHMPSIQTTELRTDEYFYEVNTVMDFMNLLKKTEALTWTR